MDKRRFFSSGIVFGMAMVLLGAGLLVVRNNLGRWLFGSPGLADPMWPLTLFICYAVLGAVALASVMGVEHLLDRRAVAGLGRRLLIGAGAIVAALAAATFLIVPTFFRTLLGREPVGINFIGILILAAAVSICAYACWALDRVSRQQREQTMRVQLESEQLATALARAELAMLEAQVEPHFLFNTLAHIKSQYRKDPLAADRMLAALIDYLDRAMPALRRADWSVGDEIELIAGYLDILVQRFGDRLRFTIVVDDADRTIRLPALTVATLVENAVRHGLAPKADGGAIEVRATRDADKLVISVSDNGVGLRDSSGSGLGLATVRARLRSAFGERAVLRVAPGDAQGVYAAISIPAQG